MLILCLMTFMVSSVKCETEVNIALLLPNDTRYPFSSGKLLPALEMGIAHVQNTLLPDVKFNVRYADTKFDMNIGVIKGNNFHQMGTVHAFFGPVCDYAVAQLARMAQNWNIPLVSVGAMASDFLEYRRQDYSSLIRAGPVNFNNVAEYVTHLINYFSWRKLKIISEGKGQDLYENYCHFLSKAVDDYLNSDNSNITSDYFKLDTEVDLDDLLVNEIENAYGVVLLCASADTVRDIMIKAEELNFDNGEYVFLNIDLFSSKGESEKPWYRGKDTTERNRKAKRAYEALMTITVRKPTSFAYRRFSDLVKSRAGYRSFGDEEVNSFVGAFHDSVILYALALNETLASNGSISNGTEIIQRMSNRTFQGITGTVSIDINGDRTSDFSLLDMNPMSGNFEVVANFFGNVKKYMPIPSKKIHWAGNRTSVPPDTPNCGFDGAKCLPKTYVPGTSDASKTAANGSGTTVQSTLTMLLGTLIPSLRLMMPQDLDRNSVS
ncbi:atrial natriuretic peptide receptor 3-like [Saccostrea echinata]|uniref:atrial natriuretic peptide receptor 3-like n=1 Tax=Saccostrea echinata TaxID=191078 RepID=UPI002A7FEEC3|nr:atrial natriuretic peptide receptor 3-like [Saccostrea echinata]